MRLLLSFILCFTASLSMAAETAPAAPPIKRSEVRGIYALDSRVGTPYKGGSLRERNWESVKDIPFLEGYAWRQNWSFFETAKDEYDFHPVDVIVRRLTQDGKKLGLLLHTEEPEYVVKNAQATWQLKHRTVDRDRPVPWDPFTL